MGSLLGRKLVVYYGLGWVQIFAFCIGLSGLDQSDDGSSWFGSQKMDPPTTLEEGVEQVEEQEEEKEQEQQQQQQQRQQQQQQQ